MRAEKVDREDVGTIVQRRHQAKIVAFDIEHDPTTLENARFRVCGLHLLGIAPLGSPGDVKPSLELRTRSLDALVAGALREVGLDEPRADDDHRDKVAWNSKIWNFSEEIASPAVRPAGDVHEAMTDECRTDVVRRRI